MSKNLIPMKKTFLITLLSLLSAMSHAQNDIVGVWEGKLAVTPAYSLKLVLRIAPEGEKLSATMDSPDQGAFGIPVTAISFENQELNLSVSSLVMSYKGKFADGRISGTFIQQGHSLPLSLERKSEEKVQEVQLDYHAEEITLINPEAGLALAGTITRPKKEGKYPAVVLLAGSGPMNRDSKFFHHQPLADIADYLTRHDIVVLRYDKRGIGKSEGEFLTATLSDFSSDAIAAVHYLSALPYVESKRLGLIGHSEGGMIATAVAGSQKGLISYLILLASPNASPLETLIYQNRLLLQEQLIDGKGGEFEEQCRELFRAVGGEGSTRASDSLALTAFNEKVVGLVCPEARSAVKHSLNDPQAIQRNLSVYQTAYFKEFLRFDPQTHLRQLECPVFALNGGKDMQVQAHPNLEIVEKILPTDRVTTKLYPTLNHLFLRCETGHVNEYMQLKGSFSEEVLRDMVRWINGR